MSARFLNTTARPSGVFVFRVGYAVTCQLPVVAVAAGSKHRRSTCRDLSVYLLSALRR